MLLTGMSACHDLEGMMHKGKILKIRMGHEANCSSGMVAMFMLMVGGVTYLPLSPITAVVQAASLPADAPQTRSRAKYWVIPQVLGVGITAFLVYGALNSGYAVSGPLLTALAMGLSFALSVIVGYKLASRIGYWVCLVNPLVLVVGFVTFEVIGIWIQPLL
jgi:hypothetical protein